MNEARSTYVRDRKCIQNFNREHEGQIICWKTQVCVCG
jgi:hypothetical protein